MVMIAILFSSCSRRIVDFTVISSKNVPLTDNGTEFKKASTRVKGTDTKWSILFVPGMPHMKEAIDRAIEKYPGAVALTDGVVYQKGWSCLLLGQNKYVVEGTPLYPEKNTNLGDTPVQTVSKERTPLMEPESTIKTEDTMRVAHIVDINETISSIAASYKVSVPEIIKWNKLKSNKLQQGMKLYIYIK